MCFRLDFYVNREITDDYRKVASEDVRVIKIVSGVNGRIEGDRPYFISVYESFGYRVGFSYETDIQVCGSEIGVGFHSYVPSMVSIKDNGSGMAEIVANNTFRTLDWFSYGGKTYEDGLYVMECVIPKGSAYYVNVYGEAVSERIRVVGCMGRVGRDCGLCKK